MAGWAWLFTKCAMVTLRRMRVDTEDVDAYKLFFLLPRLVLQPVQKGEIQGRSLTVAGRPGAVAHYSGPNAGRWSIWVRAVKFYTEI